MPANVQVGERAPAAWPTPLMQHAGAEPAILAMHFSSLNVRLGTEWTGEFVTSTSTASIEVNTNLFDFSVPGVSPGHFAFHFHMIDVPTFYIRPYALRVIARNGPGDKIEEDVPFRISGR